MPESFSHKDAEAGVKHLVLQAGLATPEQLSDAERFADKMKALGIEQDLLGVLVDRRVIDQAAAHRLRAFLREGTAGGAIEFEDELKVSGARVASGPSSAQPARMPWRLIAAGTAIVALTGLVAWRVLRPSPELRRAGDLKVTVLRLQKTGALKQALAAAEELASVPTEGDRPRLGYLVEWGAKRAGSLRLAVARAEFEEFRCSVPRVTSLDRSKLLGYRAKLVELAEKHKGLVPVETAAQDLLAEIDDRIGSIKVEIEAGKAQGEKEVTGEGVGIEEEPRDAAILLADVLKEAKALAKASRYGDALKVIRQCRRRLQSRGRREFDKELKELAESTLAAAQEAFRRKDAAARAHMWSERYGEAKNIYSHVIGTFGVDQIAWQAEVFLKRLLMIESAATGSSRRADQRVRSRSEAKRWDVLTLNSGVELRGLIASEKGDSLEFYIVRSGSADSRTQAMWTRIAKNDVKTIRRLDEAQRAAASEYLNRVAMEAGVDAGAMKRLKVEPTRWVSIDGSATKSARKVELEHFVIVADLDEDLFRKVAFRLTKVFAAYKDHFGVDRNEFEKVKVVIFNSNAEYRASLEAIGLKFLNPAFYAPDHKLIVTGFALAELRAAIADIRKQHAKLASQLDEWRSNLDEARTQARNFEHQLYEAVQKMGKVPPLQRAVIRSVVEEVRKQKLEWEVKVAKFEKQIKEAQKKIGQLNRRNDRVFDKYTECMIRATYHEGFHAFLDQFLFEEGLVKYVPRWLNEGLAKYFENARIEAGRLVLGQENPAVVAGIGGPRRDGPLVSIEELVAGDTDDYAVHGIGDAANSERHYYAAWRLVHLLGEKGRLTKENLEAFVALASFADDRARMLQALPLLTGITNAELERELRRVLGQSIKVE